MEYRKSVLIIVADDVNVTTDWKILEDSLDVVTVLGKSAAAEYFQSGQKKTDAILLCVNKDFEDGYSLVEYISRDMEWCGVPVLIMADEYKVEAEQRFLELGVWNYVVKPCRENSIKLRLLNAIDRSMAKPLERLRYLADYDVLTGIFNKNKFIEETRCLLDEYPDEKMAFVRMDIDRFQLINSFYGTEAGDEVLKFVAESVKNYVKKYSRVTYGRMEADVFALCLSYKDVCEALDQVYLIRNHFKQYPLEFDIVPAFGIYVIEDKELPVEIMLDRAKLAAKTIKGQYLNNYAFYTDDIGLALEEEQQIINEMANALEKEQFSIYFQPKYNVKSRQPVGAEALVRWEHPEMGMISPGKFIPIFEKNGFITKLDYFVWNRVCFMLRGWLDEGEKPNPISVNVSRVNLFNPNIVRIICDLVDSYEIPRDLLQLELTESAYADATLAMKDKVQKLREEGFQVLMDDFGSGYSSLNVLKDIEVDVLKIDMRFFESSDVDGRGENIVASVVRMAKWLDIPTIAEGVEKEEQVEFLKNIGCEYVQGYYFAKPMPAYAYNSIACATNGFEKYSKKSFDTNQIFAMDADLEKFVSDSTQAIAIYEYDQETLEVLRVNNAYYELMGYDDRYIRANNLLDVLEEKSRKVIQDSLEEAVQTKGTVGCEYEKVLSNGKRVWLHLKLKYINSIEGRNIIIGTHMDITSEKQVEDSFNKYVYALQSATMFDESKEDSILIVDDLEFNRNILREMMQDQYRIYEASNGREALEILEEHSTEIRLILLDIVMPIMDGREFLAIKNKNLMFRDIAVIIITAEEDTQMQLNMLESGVNDYITKPFMKESVLRRINNVLDYNNRFRDMMHEYSKIAKKLSVKNSIYDTILIVDDSDLNRAIMRDVFKNEFTVLEATNGEEALIIIQQYNYRVDVILLDLFMPVMDGVEFLNIKKQNEMMADIPVVVITADDTVAQQVNVLELGASDYVVKPIVADILIRRVNNVMESRYQYKKMLKQYYNVVEQTTADPLTHLYSRSTAEEMIMRIIKDNPDKCHALIVMDVDDFKELNDTYGHSYGDVILINLADRMKKFFRTGDVLARSTGFQFCMFMQDVPSAIIAEKKCKELLAEIAKLRIGKKQISVTCSLGIAIAENRPMKFADLYERAEVALIEAKKLGKGQTMLSKGLPMEP